MNVRGCCLAVLAVLMSGCREPVDSSDVSRSYKAGPFLLKASRTAENTWNPTGEEARLIEKFLGRFSSSRAERYREVLTRRDAILSMPKDPDGQRLLDEIYAARAARNYSEAKRRENKKATDLEMATLALVEELPGNRIEAVVLRRANVVPHDVILLSQGNATVQAFATGVMTLAGSRQKDGLVVLKDMRISSERAPLLAEWKGPLGAQTREQIGRLLTASPEYLAGIGLARSIQIMVASERMP